MTKQEPIHLSRRERQIMDIVYERGRATVAQVRDQMHDPPSYSTVRALLRLLEEKGHLRHTQDGARYVYSPTVSRKTACQSALRRLLRTFFDGSMEAAVAALLDMKSANLATEELDRLAEMIDQAKREGR